MGYVLAFSKQSHSSASLEQHEKSDNNEIKVASNMRESLRFLFEPLSGIENIDDVSKPQNKALEWMLDNTVLSEMDHPDTLVERYVITLLYFSLKGEFWDLQFLSSRHVCEWNGQKLQTGVFCNDENEVIHLLLGMLYGFVRIFD